MDALLITPPPSDLPALPDDSAMEDIDMDDA